MVGTHNGARGLFVVFLVEKEPGSAFACVSTHNLPMAESNVHHHMTKLRCVPNSSSVPKVTHFTKETCVYFGKGTAVQIRSGQTGLDGQAALPAAVLMV